MIDAPWEEAGDGHEGDEGCMGGYGVATKVVKAYAAMKTADA